MASSSTSYVFLVLLLLLVVVVPNSSFLLEPPYVILRHLPHPWVFNFDQDTEDFRQTLPKPWISVDQHGLIETLTNTTGFRIASAVLQQERCRLTSLLLVQEIYKESNGTKLFFPNCDGITIYIRPLENETEIFENNPGIIDDIRNGTRLVKKQLVEKVTRFDGGGNVSVSHPFIYYSDDEEESAVVVHGAEKGFGAMESQIKNLSVYHPHRYIDEVRGKEGVRVYGADGFESLEFPLTKEEEAEISKLKMKIEMVIVAKIVPTQRNYDYAPDSDEWNAMKLMYGDGEKAMAEFKQHDMPYRMTMLYSLHF